MLLVSAKGLNTARGMGVFEDVLEGYRRIRLLILDEWLLFPLNTTEACLLQNRKGQSCKVKFPTIASGESPELQKGH